jgi:putative ABC transport system ATP-binding protein
MIRLERVCKFFRTELIETTAINNVDIVVDRGEFVSIMGPSGCGKSTLLNIMGLIDRPDSGHYFFDGSDVTTCNERKLTDLRKYHIGFVFQNFNLIDELTVFENVELPLLYTQDISAQERREKAEAVLSRVDITARMNHFPRQLSGGQQQRVAVARALVTNPGLILADEPTGNLDSEHGAEVMAMLSQLRADGTTIIMVTHSPECAKAGDRIINLRDGRISDSIDEINDLEIRS